MPRKKSTGAKSKKPHPIEIQEGSWSTVFQPEVEPAMQITVRRPNAAAIIEIEGDIDLQHSPEARQVILENLENSKAPRVIVNLSKVRYIDSSGVASLVEGLQRAKDVKGRFILVGPSKAARELFELTRLITLFEIYDNEDQALSALGNVRAKP